MSNSKRPQIAAYYFPNYHRDVRNQEVHGDNWTEWDLVRAARPRWQGHVQPKVPAWGYTDEADPSAMAQKIDAAADHSVDAFIFDWYWYNDGPFLQRGLEEGFLQARNRARLKFALMWANHDWSDIHPKKLSEEPRILYPGAVHRGAFDAMVEYVIERYLPLPNYWRPDGRLYFSIYDLPRLVIGLGGIEPTVEALRTFRQRVRNRLGEDLHLNLVLWQKGILHNENPIEVTPAIVGRLGFDSISSYVWIHHVAMEQFPVVPYLDCWQRMKNYIDEVANCYSGIPYYPNVTMGWDASPRTVQSDMFLPTGYPFMSTLGDNTPENFRVALSGLKEWLEHRPVSERILTVNAWNEWTEGSYLEPDTVHGMAYLEAIRAVFATEMKFSHYPAARAR